MCLLKRLSNYSDLTWKPFSTLENWCVAVGGEVLADERWSQPDWFAGQPVLCCSENSHL